MRIIKQWFTFTLQENMPYENEQSELVVNIADKNTGKYKSGAWKEKVEIILLSTYHMIQNSNFPGIFKGLKEQIDLTNILYILCLKRC